MKKGKIVLSAVLSCSLAISISSSAFADTSDAKQLVALGDSITFGYNLDPGNSQPSTKAFPFLIGNDEHLSVTDLGVPGWTSTDLLNAVQTNSTFQTSIKTASVIILDIGNNDLLNIADADGLLSPSPTATIKTDLQNQLTAVIDKFPQNLSAIIQNIQQQNPSAQIVLYNLYDPISSTLTTATVHLLSEQLIEQVNQAISLVSKRFNVPVADAFDAFSGNQSSLLFQDDIHPNVQGQQVLATLGETLLQTKDTYHQITGQPNQTISRAEFVELLVKTLNLTTHSGTVYSDTENHWAKDAISTASYYGIVHGYNNATFNPDNAITREDMAIMIENAIKLQPKQIQITFKDESQISSWALRSVKILAENNIINGYPDQTFQPRRDATRAEAVSLISKLLS